MGRLIDLVDKRSGRLKVIRHVGNNEHRMSMWLCKCDCGDETIVIGNNLVRGYVKSCGCLRKETSSERCKDSKKHPRYKHGLCKMKAYIAQKSAKRRALKLNQTPDSADLEKIAKLYAVCDYMNQKSINIKWEIDHIMPLNKGGLHHEDNLRIMESSANRRKSNKIL